jgi:hypothetical protein
MRKLMMVGVASYLLAVPLRGEAPQPNSAKISAQDAGSVAPPVSDISKVTVPQRSDLEIKISSSRPQVPAGSGFGIAADITNKSNTTLFLNPKYFTMTPPPEIDPGAPADWAPLIPGGPLVDPNNPYDKVIALGPGASTTAFWAGGSPSATPNESTLAPIWREVSLLNFPPGEYTIRIVGMYWRDADSARTKSLSYQTETASLKVIVVAPQWVILCGAILGGIIAYFLLPNIRLRPNRFDLFGLFTAALLSAIVTILLSRLSETQFLIRVSINDFWGAIAIGFIVSASGTSILTRFSIAERHVKVHNKSASDKESFGEGISTRVAPSKASEDDQKVQV